MTSDDSTLKTQFAADLKAGDKVDTTTPIAETGSTGISTGPHLHFEVSYDGESINPSTILASR